MSVELPSKFWPQLGPEMKMDVHWIDVQLKDGRIYKGLVVRGGRYITGFSKDPNGEGVVPFKSDDILKVARENHLSAGNRTSFLERLRKFFVG